MRKRAYVVSNFYHLPWSHEANRTRYKKGNLKRIPHLNYELGTFGKLSRSERPSISSLCYKNGRTGCKRISCLDRALSSPFSPLSPDQSSLDWQHPINNVCSSCQIFGVFACLCFLDDVRSLYKMIGTQKTEEQGAINSQQQVVGAFAQSVPEEPGPLNSQIWDVPRLHGRLFFGIVTFFYI